MESITIKVEDAFAKQINKAMKPNYSTKTEFIREAIRDKIREIDKHEVLRALKRNFGKAKVKTSLKEDRIIREKAFRKLAKEWNMDLD